LVVKAELPGLDKKNIQITVNGGVFSNDQVWENYEFIQADIFDHVLAVTREFDLRIFQNPTGADFQALKP